MCIYICARLCTCVCIHACVCMCVPMCLCVKISLISQSRNLRVFRMSLSLSKGLPLLMQLLQKKAGFVWFTEHS